MVLYFGVRVSVRSQLVLALVSIIVVTIFFIVVIVKLGSANSLKPFNPSSAADGWSGIIFGVLYGVLLFVGFETAANLAEETPKPEKHIPAAVMITAGIATVFFLLAAYVEVAGFHYSLKTLTAAAGAPLFALGAPASAGGYGGTWIDRLLELVVFFDMLAVAIGCAVSASRGIFAMARDRRIPGVAGHRVAAARLAAGCDGVPDRRVAGHAGRRPVVARPVRAAEHPALLLAVRLGVHVRRIRAGGGVPADGGRVAAQLRGLARAGVRLVVSAVIAIAITAGAIFGSFYKVTSPTIYAPWIALAVLVIGFASTFVTRARRSASSELSDLTKSTA